MKLDVFASQVDDLVTEVKVVAHNQKSQRYMCATPSVCDSSDQACLRTPAATGAPAAPPDLVPKKRVLQQITLDSAEFTNSTVAVSKPGITLTLGKWNVAALFFNWYANKLYVVSPNTEQNIRDKMLMCAKVIAYCKCFIDPGTVIACVPVADAPALTLWHKRMTALSLRVQERLTSHAAAQGEKTRADAKVYSTFKMLQKIAVETFPQVTVVDAAIDVAFTAGCDCYNFTAIRNFRKAVTMPT
jgi:hypothetical protein